MNTKSTAKRTWFVTFACLLITGSLLGASTNLAKLAGMHGLSALAFLAWSLLGAAIILTGVAVVRGRLPRVTRRTGAYFLVSALVSVAAPQLLFFSAIPHVGASFVALAIALPPLFTYLGVLFFGLETFSIWRAAGVAFALGGAAFLAIMKLNAPDAEIFWIVATLTGPLILAIGNIYRTMRWPKDSLPDALAPGMLIAASMMLFLMGGVPGFTLFVPFDDMVPVLLIAAQTVAFALQYVLFFVLQERGGPVYMSLLGAVGALAGVPIAVLIIGEAQPDGLFIGGALIALGIGLITSGTAKSR